MAELQALPLGPLQWAKLTPRNAMPSLHAAWAFILWFNSRPFPRTYRWLAFLFVLLTILSTLSLGEHYLADLVVAFPFSVAVYALWSKAATRQIEISTAVGLALTVAWMVLLRYGVRVLILSPLVVWACIFLSTTVAWLAGRKVLEGVA